MQLLRIQLFLLIMLMHGLQGMQQFSEYVTVKNEEIDKNKRIVYEAEELKDMGLKFIKFIEQGGYEGYALKEKEKKKILKEFTVQNVLECQQPETVLPCCFFLAISVTDDGIFEKNKKAVTFLHNIEKALLAKYSSKKPFTLQDIETFYRFDNYHPVSGNIETKVYKSQLNIQFCIEGISLLKSYISFSKELTEKYMYEVKKFQEKFKRYKKYLYSTDELYKKIGALIAFQKIALKNLEKDL